MTAPLVVRLQVVGDEPAQVVLFEGDHLVETVVAKRADHPVQ